MKQRDTLGRYTKVYRKASRWEILFVYSVIGGVLFFIVFDIINKPYVFEAQQVAEAYVEKVIEPEIVIIEVQYETDGIERLIRETFIETPNTAVAVAKGESGHTLKADAYNPEWHYDSKGNKVCQGSYGVMQVACVHNLADPEALFDVQLNLKKAREIYLERGWFPWGAYRNGSWKKYL